MEKLVYLFFVYLGSVWFPESIVLSTSNVCDENWSYFKPSCYSWHPRVTSNRREAEKKCESQNSFLASFGTRQTYQFIGESVLKSSNLMFWSSLHRCQSSKLFWADGTAPRFTSFKLGEPNNFEGNENCVEIYSDGTWNDQNCFEPREFICQNVTCSRKGSNPETSCLYLNRSKSSWFGAKRHCKNAGDTLVKITNSTVNFAAMVLASSCDHGCWIGLQRQDRLCWGNGNHVVLEKRGSVCKHSSESCNCVAMDTAGVWIELSCGAKKPFVCQKDANQCLDPTNECHDNALCVNSHGSYTCHCKSEFIGNGKVCVEPDDFDMKMINFNETEEVKTVIKSCSSMLEAGTNNTEAVIKVLEDVAISVGNQMKEDEYASKEFIFQAENINLGVVLVKKDDFKGFTYPDDFRGLSENNEKIVFPRSIFPFGDKDSAVVAVMIYDTPSEMSSLVEADWFVNSKTVAGMVDPKPAVSSRNPVQIVLKKLKNVVKGEVQCVFWKFRDGEKGMWSTEGCHLSGSNHTHAICECHHLTNFAILMRVHSSDKVSDEGNIVLKVITFIGLVTSIIGCFLTLVVHLYFPKLRRDRGFIHINLVVALGIADFVFMIAILLDPNDDSCMAMALLVFYFFLAVFFWMLVEGLHIYLMVTKVFDTKARRMKFYYGFIGWILPLFIVGLTYACLRADVLSIDYCWLSVSSGAIWAFVGPVIFIILVNVLIMLLVLKVTFTMLPEDPENGRVKSAFRAFLMLTPVLGVTWIFGLLTIAKYSSVFQYIFAILNSFQGLLIFVLYCLFNQEARRELSRKVRAIRSSREVSISRPKSAKERSRTSRSPSKSSLSGAAKEAGDNLSPERYKPRKECDVTGKLFTTTQGAANVNHGLENDTALPEVYPFEHTRC